MDYYPFVVKSDSYPWSFGVDFTHRERHIWAVDRKIFCAIFCDAVFCAIFRATHSAFWQYRLIDIWARVFFHTTEGNWPFSSSWKNFDQSCKMILDKMWFVKNCEIIISWLFFSMTSLIIPKFQFVPGILCFDVNLWQSQPQLHNLRIVFYNSDFDIFLAAFFSCEDVLIVNSDTITDFSFRWCVSGSICHNSETVLMKLTSHSTCWIKQFLKFLIFWCLE